MTKCTRESGTCRVCQSYCERKPGWFLPGEAEKAAELMGLSLARFFQEYLAVDWWEGEDDSNIFLLSPAITSNPAGEEFPGNPRGTCVFFQRDRCQIHAAKPTECRDALCTDVRNDSIHRQMAEAWDNETAQEQVRGLLGREPEAEAYEPGSALDIIFDLLR